MKFIPSKSLKAWLEQTSLRLKRILQIEDYNIIFEYVDEVKSYSHSFEIGGYEMEMEFDKTYLQIDIKIASKTQKRFDQGELKELENILIHELLHSILYSYDEFVKNINDKNYINVDESITQKLTMIIHSLI